MAGTMQTTATPTPTPIIVTPRTAWALLAATVVGALAVAWAAPDATRILLGGLALAMFLSFPVGLLDRLMPRGLAIVVTLLALIAAGALVLAFVLPVLGEQLGAVIDALPRWGTRIEE